MLKKWALQMRSFGGYFKHSAMIDGKHNTVLSKCTYVLLTILFSLGFFIWTNDRVFVLGYKPLNDCIEAIMNSGDLDFEQQYVLVVEFFNLISSLSAFLIRLFVVPVITLILSMFIMLPSVCSGLYECLGIGSQFLGKKLFTNIKKHFLKLCLIVIALIIPFVIVGLFGGKKLFFDYGFISAVVYSIIFVLAVFTICFLIDPNNTDEGSHYPYIAISSQVKKIIRARFKNRDKNSFNNQIYDVRELISNLEKAYEVSNDMPQKKLSAFKKAWLLFRITWGKTLTTLIMINLITPMIQTLLMQLLSYTKRSFVVYIGLGFFAAFAIMFEIRLIIRMYTDQVHGTECSEQTVENDDSIVNE